MAAGRQSDTADAPSNHMEKQIELRPGVLFDSAGLGNFGDVTMQPEPTATRGVDTVAGAYKAERPFATNSTVGLTIQIRVPYAF